MVTLAVTWCSALSWLAAAESVERWRIKTQQQVAEFSMWRDGAIETWGRHSTGVPQIDGSFSNIMIHVSKICVCLIVSLLYPLHTTHEPFSPLTTAGRGPAQVACWTWWPTLALCFTMHSKVGNDISRNTIFRWKYLLDTYYLHLKLWCLSAHKQQAVCQNPPMKFFEDKKCANRWRGGVLAPVCNSVLKQQDS